MVFSVQSNQNYEPYFALTLQEHFSNSVAKSPDKMVMHCGDISLTYFELDKYSDIIADNLVSAGIEQGETILVNLARSCELAVAILAVVKAGCIYAVVNSSWSNADAQMQCDQLHARYTVGDTFLDLQQIPINFAKLATKCVVPNLPTIHSAQPSCVFFTSGTTGKAKGVLCSHVAIARLFAPNNLMYLPDSAIIAIAANPCWDAFAFEFWGVLLTGGTGVMISEKFLSPDSLRNAISTFGVNSAWMTSSLFNLTIDEDPGALNGLETLLIGGEKLSHRHVTACLETYPSLKLINGYGPVENTVFTTTHQILSTDLKHQEIPIGTTVPGTQVFIRNGKHDCDTNEIGDILVGGLGLACKYIGASKDATQAFITEQQSNGKVTRLYRTGDRGWLDSDGILHFSGRADRQIKLRGIRIDPPEIEEAIEVHSDISQCRVLARKQGSEVVGLVAFCIPSDSRTSPDPESVFAQLPITIRPEKLISVASFPYTDNGKLDEKSLLLQTDKSQTKSNVQSFCADCSPPWAPLRAKIEAIFDDICGPSTTGLTSDLFARGGQSLDAARIVTKLNTEVGVQARVSDVLGYPTPCALARHLEQKDSNSDTSTPNSLSAVQTNFLIRQMANPDDITGLCTVYWQFPTHISFDLLEVALQAIQASQPALSGTYHLDPYPRWNETHGAAISLERLEPCDDALGAVFRSITRPIDPIRGPIWQAAACLTASGTIFGIAVHHIAFDGDSEKILSSAINRILNGEALQKQSFHSTLKQLSIGKTSTSLTETKPLSWPSIKSNSSTEPIRNIVHFNQADYQAISDTARTTQLPRIALFLAAWSNVLLDVTSQSEVNVGVPINERPIPHAQDVVGCFISMIAVHLSKDSNGLLPPEHAMKVFCAARTHADFAQAPSASWLKLYANRGFPYQTILTLHDAKPRSLKYQDQIAPLLKPFTQPPICEVSIDLWVGHQGEMDVVLCADPKFLSSTTVQQLAEGFRSNILSYGG